MNLLERAKRLLRRRQIAYARTFTGEDGEYVLADLAVFCRAGASTFDRDPYASSRLEGRREVWLRIAATLRLSDEELWRLSQRGMTDE